MSKRGPLFWILVPVFMVVGLIVVRLMPDGYDEHKQELVELFHLPDDVEFVSFASPYRRGSLGHIEGIARFDREQWQAYVADLDRAEAWPVVPFSFRGTEVVAPRDAEAMAWWEHEGAWIMGREYASFWVNWGFQQSKEHGGLPTVAKAKAWRSQCWAVIGEGEQQRMEPCRNYKHRPPGLKFYVRAKLNAFNRALYMTVR